MVRNIETKSVKLYATKFSGSVAKTSKTPFLTICTETANKGGGGVHGFKLSHRGMGVGSYMNVMVSSCPASVHIYGYRVGILTVSKL